MFRGVRRPGDSEALVVNQMPDADRVAAPVSKSGAEGGTTILFVTRLPPDPDGPGGTQRAMQLLRALASIGIVDLVLLHRSSDLEAVKTLSGPAQSLVRNFAALEISEWAPAKHSVSKWKWKWRQIEEVFRLHAVDAPRFSASMISKIASVLPESDYDVIFAGRLSSACIVNQLMSNGQLRARTRVSDLDDLISRFRERELKVVGAAQGMLRRILQRISIRRVRNAELEICRHWDAVGLPVAEELEWLRARVPAAALQLFPNVVDRRLLPIQRSTKPNILFVGHLGYTPNIDGLRTFLTEAWPCILQRVPEATLTVVGMYPDLALSQFVADNGGKLYANVPSVEPYYQNSTLVISPIRYASGTRIKIIEAMAFGRPVVSTKIGAEGLQIKSGDHALIVDDMKEFSEAVVRLCTDDDLYDHIVFSANVLQKQKYSLDALTEEIREAIMCP